MPGARERASLAVLSEPHRANAAIARVGNTSANAVVESFRQWVTRAASLPASAGASVLNSLVGTIVHRIGAAARACSASWSAREVLLRNAALAELLALDDAQLAYRAGTLDNTPLCACAHALTEVAIRPTVDMFAQQLAASAQAYFAGLMNRPPGDPAVVLPSSMTASAAAGWLARVNTPARDVATAVAIALDAARHEHTRRFIPAVERFHANAVASVQHAR